MIRVGSLFAGIGGFDLGFARAGMATAWACEIDAKARAVFRRHFPGVPIHHDARELRGDALEPVDLLCGGFPCQDLSIAGLRAGLAGERSALFFEIVRLVDELSPPPRWIVLENVTGLLSSRGGRDMGIVVREVERRGYGLCWRVLDSRYFGVAQQRRRVFLVGCLGNWRDPVQVLFEPEGLRRHRQTRRREKTKTAGGAAAGPGVRDGAGNHGAPGRYVPAVSTALRSRDAKGSPDSDVTQTLLCFGGNDASGPIDVATACRAKGGTGHGDFESETFVAGSLCSGGRAAGSATQQDAEKRMLVVHATGAGCWKDGAGTLRARPQESHEHLVAHAPRADGHDASEDGTGRGTPLVVSLSPGDRGVSVDQACAGMIQPVAVGLGSDPSFAVDRSLAMTGRNGDPGVIAFQERTRGDDGRGYDRPPNVHEGATGSLETVKPWCVALRGREGAGTAELGGDVSHAVRASQGGGDKPHVLAKTRVRRLMPVECERLQGFPDGWTAWGLGGRRGEAAMRDGPRYKMLGNAVTVPVAEWIGRRVVAAEAVKLKEAVV